MISKSKSNFIIALQKKKVRDDERLFVIEGDKLVKEFLSTNTKVKILVARPEFLNSLPSLLTRLANEIVEVSNEKLKHISTLKTPHNALAVVPMPEPKMDSSEILSQLCICLDFVQGPRKSWHNNKSCRLVWY